MLTSNNIARRLGLPALLLLSPSVLAGGGGSVSYLPSSLFDAGTLGVPTMSNALLIVLGLLLAVIAVRVLKGRTGFQKVLSIALLGGGLAIGGFGVERTVATTSVTAGKAGCEIGDTLNYNANNPSDNRAVYFSNSCEVELTISDSNVSCNPGWTLRLEAAPGERVKAGDGTYLSWCEEPER